MADNRQNCHELSHAKASKEQSQLRSGKSAISSREKSGNPKTRSPTQIGSKELRGLSGQPTDKGKQKGNVAQRSPSSSRHGETSRRQSLSETSSSEQPNGKGKERSQGPTISGSSSLARTGDLANVERESPSQRIDRLQAELINEKKRTINLEQRIREKNHEIHALRGQKINALVNRADSGGNNSDAAEWQRRYEDLKETFDIAIRDQKCFVEELEEADRKIEELRGSLRSVRSELEDEKQRGDSLQEESNKLLRRIDELLEQLAQTQRERDDHKARNEELGGQRALPNEAQNLPLMTPSSGSQSNQDQSGLTSQETTDGGSNSSQWSRAGAETLLAVGVTTKKGETLFAMEVAKGKGGSKYMRRVKHKRRDPGLYLAMARAGHKEQQEILLEMATRNGLPIFVHENMKIALIFELQVKNNILGNEIRKLEHEAGLSEYKGLGALRERLEDR
ncbi:MAG: hypothetical protein M1840_007686 [Geoglossum simile]|nr:MAG: hypothetical protein M1840_007686 [Geoglossum simile]